MFVILEAIKKVMTILHQRNANCFCLDVLYITQKEHKIYCHNKYKIQISNGL